MPIEDDDSRRDAQADRREMRAMIFDTEAESIDKARVYGQSTEADIAEIIKMRRPRAWFVASCEQCRAGDWRHWEHAGPSGRT